MAVAREWRPSMSYFPKQDFSAAAWKRKENVSLWLHCTIQSRLPRYQTKMGGLQPAVSLIPASHHNPNPLPSPISHAKTYLGSCEALGYSLLSPSFCHFSNFVFTSSFHASG